MSSSDFFMLLIYSKHRLEINHFEKQGFIHCKQHMYQVKNISFSNDVALSDLYIVQFYMDSESNLKSCLYH